ncbi:hypothetical protein ACKJSM_10680 [Pseudomonas sp. PHC1]|uniref:hypothetical protein n=1 Tax=Pseudomonas sp. PHC1 TaxID=3384759 RepID=UPI00396F4680
MKPLSLLVSFALAALTSSASADTLSWNDPAISDGPCTDPPALQIPLQFFNTLKGLPQGFRVYLPFGNKAYYRWIHQKINGGVAATDESQIFATKPRVTFPDLLAPLFWAVGKVDVYDHTPVDKWYYVQAIPKNLIATDLSVNIVNPSPGSAPYGFGGTDIPSRFVWADPYVLVEWHCFAGNVQVVNVISLIPALTSEQISKISAFLKNYGFQSKNFMTMPY